MSSLGPKGLGNFIQKGEIQIGKKEEKGALRKIKKKVLSDAFQSFFSPFLSSKEKFAVSFYKKNKYLIYQ